MRVMKFLPTRISSPQRLLTFWTAVGKSDAAHLPALPVDFNELPFLRTSHLCGVLSPKVKLVLSLLDDAPLLAHVCALLSLHQHSSATIKCLSVDAPVEPGSSSSTKVYPSGTHPTRISTWWVHQQKPADGSCRQCVLAASLYIRAQTNSLGVRSDELVTHCLSFVHPQSFCCHHHQYCWQRKTNSIVSNEQSTASLHHQQHNLISTRKTVQVVFLSFHSCNRPIWLAITFLTLPAAITGRQLSSWAPSSPAEAIEWPRRSCDQLITLPSPPLLSAISLRETPILPLYLSPSFSTLQFIVQYCIVSLALCIYHHNNLLVAPIEHHLSLHQNILISGGFLLKNILWLWCCKQKNISLEKCALQAETLVLKQKSLFLVSLKKRRLSYSLEFCRKCCETNHQHSKRRQRKGL